MSIFDLVIWGIIAWYVGKNIKKWLNPSGSDSGSGSPSMTSEDGTPLTDTQIKWRQHKAQVNADKLAENGDQAFDDLRKTFTPEQRKLLDATLYIQENIRQFNFYEWLIRAVDPRMQFRYMLNMGFLAVVMIALPLFLGWPITPLALLGFTIFYDVMLDRHERILEVTKWNPEFEQKFGKQ